MRCRWRVEAPSLPALYTPLCAESIALTGVSQTASILSIAVATNAASSISLPLPSRALVEHRYLVGTPVKADRPKAGTRFVEEAIVFASHCKRPKRKRLDVRLRVHPAPSLRLDPVVSAEGDERVKERCSAVVEADTVYSDHSHPGARGEFDRIDKSLNRRCVIAGECEAEL